MPDRTKTAKGWRHRLVNAGIGVLLLASGAPSYAIDALEEYSRRVDGARNIAALGEDMFGDETNYFNGATSFRITDVSIPGNSALPVSIGRTHTVGEQLPDAAGLFGEWDLDIPYMTGIYATGYPWQVEGVNPNSRCSGVSPTGAYRPPTVMTGPAASIQFDGHEYWSGNTLHVPGAGDQSVLQPDVGYTRRPQDGNTYRWTTTGNWFFSCLPALANSASYAGEGFVALAPDGTRYYFDWMSARRYAPLDRKGRTANTTYTHNLTRQKVFLYPTRVVDRFGNWVRYDWTGDRLTGIVASDGRALSLTYVQAGSGDNASWKIQTVSDGTRTWQYRYALSGRLERVTLPDNTAWELSTQTAIVGYETDYFGSVRNCDPRPIARNLAYTYTMRHPAGAQATFEFKAVEHGRARAPLCQWDPDAQKDVNEAPAMHYHTMSLVKKRIDGSGAIPREWLVAYSTAEGSRETCTSCPTTKSVAVTDSAGSFARYTFSTHYGRSEGKLLQIDRGANALGILSSETHTYDDDPTAPATFIRYIGSAGNYRGSDLRTGRIVPEKTRTIVRDGVAFTRENETFDSFARPLVVRKASSLNHVRREQTEYIDFLNLWVLGQVRRQYNINTAPILMAETEYNTSALPWKTSSYDKLQNILGYNADGTLATITDGRSYVTRLESWKRGVPQTIRFPDTNPLTGTLATRSIGVNDIGWITSVTDENGYATGYGHDAMGRLASIVHPTGDSVAWANEQFDFRPLTSSDYLPPGISAGQWRHFSGKANYAKFTYYDALWRPVLVQEYDTSNRAGTLRTTKTDYTSDGLVSFQSYPSSTDQPLTTGSRTEYDALDRVRFVRTDSELGTLTTQTEYLADLKTRVTNPRGFSTITEFAAWDEPNYDLPTTIFEPENKITEIRRDVFGKPTRLIRRSADNSLRSERLYYYDDNQLLCQVKEPETGATVMSYDEAGNLTMTASGFNSAINCDRYNASRSSSAVLRTYDERNRLTTLNFRTGDFGDQIWTYTPDGLPATVTTYNAASQGEAVINTYQYNRRRLLTGESMSQPGRAVQSVGYQYDANGVMANQTLPTGLSIHHTLNGLGQSTRVYDQSGQNYATSIRYYPNGAIRDFVYGNGILHTMAQNARQMPQRVTDGGNAQDNEYVYDGNGNVRSITNHIPLAKLNALNRAMQYDGLDRLMQAQYGIPSAVTELHSFQYNALDDLTSWRTSTDYKDYAEYVYDPNTRRLNSIRNGAGATVVGIGYDAQGNVTNKNGLQMEFDYGNRLRKTVGVESYRYDAHGRRVAAIGINRASIHSFYNQAGQLIQQENARPDGNKAEDFIHLAGSPLAVRERNLTTNAYTVKYFHTDALGSPVATSDQAGTVLKREIYEPYGFNAPRQNIGYAGHIQDAATGLTYMQQRYYDPTIGRFLSVDPVAADAKTGGNFNRYWYANNNPYRYTDPDGRFGVDEGTLGMMTLEVKKQVSDAIKGMGRQIMDAPGVTAGLNIAESLDVKLELGAAMGFGIELEISMITGDFEISGNMASEGAEASLTVQPRDGLSFFGSESNSSAPFALKGGPELGVGAGLFVGLETKAKLNGGIELTPKVGVGVGEMYKAMPSIVLYSTK